jgi:O-acetyl-ADP-ribose deacetylase (regulator of RNase III)
LEECKKLGGCRSGDAKITSGGRPPAKYVIHTVGPIWRGGEKGEDETLASAYRRSLEVALENGASTVSFPSISTGAYRFPADRAARIALGTIIEFLKTHQGIQEVNMVLFGDVVLKKYESALAGMDV